MLALEALAVGAVIAATVAGGGYLFKWAIDALVGPDTVYDDERAALRHSPSPVNPRKPL